MIVGKAIKKLAMTVTARKQVAQRFGKQQRSRSAANSDHGQIATVLEAVNGDDEQAMRQSGIGVLFLIRARAFQAG